VGDFRGISRRNVLTPGAERIITTRGPQGSELTLVKIQLLIQTKRILEPAVDTSGGRLLRTSSIAPREWIHLRRKEGMRTSVKFYSTTYRPLCLTSLYYP